MRNSLQVTGNDNEKAEQEFHAAKLISQTGDKRPVWTLIQTHAVYQAL